MIFGADKLSGDYSWEYLPSHKVTISLYVFSSLIKDQVSSNVESNLIVT